MPISYDPSRAALFHPGQRPTVLRPGDQQQLPIEALCAECSRLAYLHFEGSEFERQILAEALRHLGAHPFQPFNDPATGTEGFGVVLPSAGTQRRPFALLVFRGTEPDTLSDLATDLNASRVAGPGGGHVHAGFSLAFQRVQPAIAAWLATTGSIPLVFTGHSLGAALATLAAAQWPSARLVTFGSPRVGDADFARTLADVSHTRYVDCCDVVTRIPPPLSSLYAHATPATYIDRGGVVHPPEVPDDLKAADRSRAQAEYLQEHAWKPGNVLVRELADHAPINYVRALVTDR